MINVAQIQQVCHQLFGNVQIDVLAKYNGYINQVFKLLIDGSYYGLRIRVNENIFIYEHNIFKETIINEWFKAYKQDRLTQVAPYFDASVYKKFPIDMLDCFLPKTITHDFSRTAIPFPYCIYEWCHGDTLWDHKDKHLYYLAGKKLKAMHCLKFDAFYNDFNSLGQEKLDWEKRYSLALERELLILAQHYPASDIATIRKFKTQIGDNTRIVPYLIHNDFSGGNILVQDGAIQAVVDWDNAVIDSPELDFLKMKYWTVYDNGSRLNHDKNLYNAFVDGYGVDTSFTDSPIFRCYEILWLTRMINFTNSQQNPNQIELEKYQHYLDCIMGLCKNFSTSSKV